jgi:hypothetical protein
LADAVIAFVFVANEAVMSPDEREQAFGATQDPRERVSRMIFVPSFEVPNDPRMEGIVASPGGDIRDSGQ